MKSFRHAVIVFALAWVAGCAGSARQIEEVNAELVRSFAATINAGDWESLDQLLAEDFVRHGQPTAGPAANSKARFLALQQALLASFPDQQVSLDLVVADGDRVAALGRYAGTMTGRLGGYAATGKTMEGQFLSMFRIQDGRIAELWVEWDNLSALTQLGLPPPVDGLALLARYLEAHRSGDIGALLKLHTGDAMFTIEGRPPYSGWESLRELFEWDAALQSELEFSDVNIDGSLLTIGAATGRNRLFRELGVEEVRYRPGLRFKLRGSLIQGIYVPGFDQQSQKAVEAAFQPLIEWLASHDHDALARLMPDGRFRYDAASAAQWLEIVAAWRSAQEGAGPAPIR